MRRPPADATALVAVHLVIALGAFACGWYVHTQATPLPLIDEWGLLHEWADRGSVWEWVWRHHNDHRYPLTKCLWMACLHVTGFRFDFPQYFSVGLMASAAILVAWTARGLRGRARLLDVLPASLLLHFGHGLSWLMGYQFGFALAVYSLVGWLWCAGRLHNGAGQGWAVLSGLYVTVVVLCGGFGIAFTPPAALWFCYLARTAFAGGRRFVGATFVSWAVAILGYGIWATLTTSATLSAGNSPIRQPVEFFAIFGGYLTAAVGPWPAWPAPPAYRIAAGALVSIAYLAGGLALLRTAFRRPLPTAVALVVLGTLLTGAATAYSRPGALLDRYAAFSGCGLIALYLLVVAARVRTTSRRVVGGATVAGLLLSAGVFWLNEQAGMTVAQAFRYPSDDTLRDLLAGDPPMVLGGRYAGVLNVLRPSFAEDLRACRREGIPPFAKMTPDPPFVPRPVAGITVPVKWECSAEAFTAGQVPSLALPDPPARAFALRLKADYSQQRVRSKVLLRWKDHDTGAERSAVVHPAIFPARMIHVFPFGPRATSLVLTLGGAVEDIAMSEFEWLMPME